MRETMTANPFSGVYVFWAKLADWIKLVFWNGTDLFAKRLTNSIFQ
jgi:hypothetical protein